tara:strand:- start:896 stop:2038 length:1143 start_codon:yes stop_codon:yes gene_type:complete
MKYLLNIPFLDNKEKIYVKDVISKNWLSINGFHTKVFEKKFSKYLNIKHTLAVQSGTAAIHTALKSIGIKKNDKVIVPNYTCVSNISALSQIQAKPIIVDVEKDTFGLDAKLLAKAIKRYKPKAVQLVHVYGFPARDTIEIIKLCKKYKIYLIEDASEALGAKIGNKKVGTFGDIGTFSIRSEKMIGVGEGGTIVTNNNKIWNKTKLIASRHAPFRSKKDPYWKKYYCNGEGYNYLMPHLLGAVARAQIEKFENKILSKKIKIGKFYRKIFLPNNNYTILQNENKNFKSAFWLNAIYFKNKNSNFIKKIGDHLIKNGIEVRSGFWPLSEMKFFKTKSITSKKYIVSNDLFKNLLILPSNIKLKEKDILFIKKKIDSFLNK